MGGSSSKKKKKEEEKLNKINKNNDIQKEEEKEKNIKKVDSFKNGYQPKIEMELNGPLKTFESRISEQIYDKKPIFIKKDYNLETTNFFNSNIYILEEKNIKDKIYHKYQQILYNIESKGISENKNNYLDELNKKINSDFGLKKLIKDDFDKTKINILYCSTLTENDEILINMLDYNEYLKDEKKSQNVIKNVINNNIEEMMSKIIK